MFYTTAMPKLINLIGFRFAELTVEKLADYKINNRPAWVCICDCGERKTVAGESLKSGDVKCCGKHKTKFYIETFSNRSKLQNRKYPKATDSHSRLYTLWRAMLARCNNPSHAAYSRYGGSGIKVCKEWETYSSFVAWALSSGYKSQLTIDREKNDKGYYPWNCRWATSKEQARNRKSGLIEVEAFGQLMPLVDWGVDPRCKVGLGTLRKRLAAGHSAEFALTANEHQIRCAAQSKRET